MQSSFQYQVLYASMVVSLCIHCSNAVDMRLQYALRALYTHPLAYFSFNFCMSLHAAYEVGRR
eukprot:scaffold9680_cov32-Tisochrysis_lutea.AAC.2